MKNTTTAVKANKTVMVLLILGLSTIIFPLYMTIIIAFKQPSEMTNSISGILSLPKTWSLDNFREAMEVTDFWRSLRNSLLISVLTVVLSIIIHSLMGYTLGRNKGSKFYNFVYLFIVSGMFGKADSRAGIGELVRRYLAICCILYADERHAVFGLSGEYSTGAGRGGKGGRRFHMAHLLEDHFSDHEADARNGCGHHSIGCME